MKKLLFFVAALLFSSSVFAAEPVPTEMWRSNNQAMHDRTSALASCAAYATWTGYLYNPRLINPTGDPVSSYICDMAACPTCGYSGGNQVVTYSVGTVPMCADGSAPDTTKPLAQQCPETCPSAGTSINLSWPVGYVGADGRPIGSLNIPAMGTPVAHSGCAYSIGNAVPNSCTSNPSAAVPRLVSCSYQANGLGRASTGADATPTAPPAPSTTPDNGKCPSGTVSGGVDSSGIPICIGNKTASDPNAGKQTTTTTPKVTNPDGSTTETEVTKRTNADGSETTTTKTTETSTDGSKSVSVTQSTSAKPTGEAGKDDENSDFCEKNPQLTICKNSTVSGSCENTACEGDAIQCEILRVARKRQCSEETETPESQLGQQLLNGSDPLGGTLPKMENAANVNIGSSLDQSGFLGSSGTCLSDKTFSAGGMSFTLPFSSVCPYLLPFRYMMSIIAALVSLRLVGKSIFA